jgi:acetyl-CoA carboxylase biotin carboxyl carrier protein
MVVSSSHDAVKRVVEAFERSDWSEIDVRSDSLRVHLSTSAPTATSDPSRASAATGRWASDEHDDVRAPEVEALATASSSPQPTGAQVVASPSPGIFWRSPEPGLPPFADVGHTVEASATVCIVEVMKLMNHVKAGVSGEVVAVYCENGATVRKGQALFAIAPSGSSS